MSVEQYLKDNDKRIGAIFSFDDNGNEYDYEFFLCDDGESDNTAHQLDIRKMENVGTMQLSLEDAIELGFTGLSDFVYLPT